MKTIFTTTLLFLSVFVVFAQQKIEGIRFVNADNKIPVQDLSLIADNRKFSAVSDMEGYVNLKNMPAGTQVLTVSGIGYEKQVLDLAQLTPVNGVILVYVHNMITTLADVEVKASATGGIFKTISDLDIHLRPIVNSQEVLRIVPGLFIGQHAGGGKAEQIFLRGFDIDHGTDINITVDGMPVNMVSHAHGQGYADLHFVIPELIEKVNFNKGPYFADKGNLATAGYVAFRTQNYLDRNFIKLEAGQYNTYRAIAAVNLLQPKNTYREQSLYVAGEGSYTKGYFESPQNFNRFNGLIKYHGKISAASTLTASLSGFTSKWNASGQIPDRAVEDGSIGFYGAIDNKEGGKTSRYNANLELATELNNGGILKNQVYYTRYAFELYSNFTFFKEDTANGDQIRQKEQRDLAGYNGSYQKAGHWGKLNTQTNAGIQVRFDQVNNIELSRTKDKTLTTDPIQLGNIRELNTSAYASQQVFINDALDITGGIRLDYFANRYNDILHGNTTASSGSFIASPKLNINYRLNRKVQFYWYNGQGFHSNDTRVAVAQNGRDVVTPAWGSDLGGIFKIGNKVVVQSALWYLWLKQEFVYVGDEGVVEPGGRTRRIGMDLSLRYEFLKNFYLDADVSLADPRALDVPETENRLPLAPTFTSTGGITYRKGQGFNGSLRYRFMGNRPANEDNSVVAKGYFITDAAINYTRKRFEVGIAIQNVLNTRWKETQFDTESRLKNEPAPVSEIHFTPGTPFFARFNCTLFF
jgi:hypothetical protein